MMDRNIRALAGELGAGLRAETIMCATAESCTGGLLAAAITSCPGSGHWFERGFVTYSNDAKIEQLQVLPATLEQHGAVSEQTAMEMACGVLQAVRGAGIALSTTGIAGPDGASPGKPVGMVCFGLARRADDGIVSRAVTQIFAGERDDVRRESVRFALRLALESLAGSSR